MDIFSLRERARAEHLAARIEIRDPAWERGPVGIVLRADILRDLALTGTPDVVAHGTIGASACAAYDHDPCGRCSASGR